MKPSRNQWKIAILFLTLLTAMIVGAAETDFIDLTGYQEECIDFNETHQRCIPVKYLEIVVDSPVINDTVNVTVNDTNQSINDTDPIPDPEPIPTNSSYNISGNTVWLGAGSGIRENTTSGGLRTQNRLLASVEAANMYAVNYTLFLGDNLMNGNTEYYERFNWIVSTLASPRTAIHGNHDGQWWKENDKIILRAQDAAFLLFDSNRHRWDYNKTWNEAEQKWEYPYKYGSIEPDQTQWVNDTIESLRGNVSHVYVTTEREVYHPGYDFSPGEIKLLNTVKAQKERGSFKTLMFLGADGGTAAMYFYEGLYFHRTGDINNGYWAGTKLNWSDSGTHVTDCRPGIGCDLVDWKGDSIATWDVE